MRPADSKQEFFGCTPERLFQVRADSGTVTSEALAGTRPRGSTQEDDEELLRRRWAQVVPATIGADRIELVKDENVHSGGAIIETNHGQVDAQLETKLSQLGNALWTFVVDVSAPETQDDANA